MRRANHDKITPVQLVACPNCSEPFVPHRVCGSCGFYKGAKVAGAKLKGAGSKAP